MKEKGTSDIHIYIEREKREREMQRRSPRWDLKPYSCNAWKVVTSTQRQNMYTIPCHIQYSMLCGLFHLLCVSSQHLHNFGPRANSAWSSEKRITVFTCATYLLPTANPKSLYNLYFNSIVCGAHDLTFLRAKRRSKAIFFLLKHTFFVIFIKESL